MQQQWARRLAVLEQQRQAKLGYKCFYTSADDPNVYFEATGRRLRMWPEPGERLYTHKELDLLRAQGWEIMVVEWVRDWRPGEGETP